MAWEWVSPVAAASGGFFGGVVGAYFAWLSGKQSRDQVSRTLQEQFGHDRLQAREDREQQRLENAYLELLRMTERVGQWAQIVYPFLQTGPLPETPMPPLEVQADTAALLAAFGTEEVREKTEAWRAVVNEMRVLAELVPREDANPSYVPPGERIARVKIHEIRPDEKRKRDELGAQISSELAFGYRSTRSATGVTRTYVLPAQNPPTSASE